MTDINNIHNLKMEYKHIENSETCWIPNGVQGCDKETFIRNNPGINKSIFNVLDINKDGYITEQEYRWSRAMDENLDGVISDKERILPCMKQLKFDAKRDIDKWFSVDKNRDGFESTIEAQGWNIRNKNGKTLEGAMSNDEIAKKYNLKEEIICDMQGWLDGTIEELKADAKNKYGVELNESQIIELKKEQIKQLNTWLFKEGDNENSSLYQQLSLDAYTRLMSTVDGESCCGGDICEIPDFSPSDIERIGKYTAKDVKARLDWAENSYKIDENGKAVYDEKGERIPAKIMTEHQVEMYKKIVESVTGKPWDSEDWEVTPEQWSEISDKVNGTFGDETRLNGKTRDDIPENRQALLRFLEEKGWLYEQFK